MSESRQHLLSLIYTLKSVFVLRAAVRLEIKTSSGVISQASHADLKAARMQQTAGPSSVTPLMTKLVCVLLKWTTKVQDARTQFQSLLGITPSQMEQLVWRALPPCIPPQPYVRRLDMWSISI
jgi:hypothetical protein